MATVTFDHVYKKYGEVTAVSDLNLEIGDGEFMVLVGPSGCGKTTSLRMIAGLEEITDGTLRIGDRVVNDVAPKDRDIAMVFQSYALYPHMSVRDNLAFGLKLRKVPKPEIEKRINEAAGILQLEKLLARKPKELSGGQRQRVALGRAIVREPAVFLMDEPLSNLDAKLRVQTRAEIARLHQRLKTTMVYVTHDQVEAMTMGERIAVMSDGLLQQVGTPQELYDHPKNRFVAGFIGSPSMNFIEMPVGSGDLVEGGFTFPVPARYAEAIKTAGPDVLVARRRELLGPWQVHPQLEAVEQPARGHEPIRRFLDVEDPGTGRHPLRVAVGDHAPAAVRVAVLEHAVQHVGHRLEPAVRMPRRPLRLAGRVLDLAHLVQVDERVEVLQRSPGECAADGEALALETARGGGQGADRPLPGGHRVRGGDAGEDGDVVDGDGRHGGPCVAVVACATISPEDAGCQRPFSYPSVATRPDLPTP